MVHTNEMVLRKLALIIRDECKDPRLQKITLTRVEASSDASFAKVLFTFFPSDGYKDTEETLNQASGFFSFRLGRALQTRKTPKLLFKFDPGFDYSIELDAKLREESAALDQ